jgi:predicted CXXCH cytochrome family protein
MILLRRSRILVVLFALGGSGWWFMERYWHGDDLGYSGGSQVIGEGLREASHFPPSEAIRCVPCHRAEFVAWVGSHHALANRLVDPEKDEVAFVSRDRLLQGDFTTETSLENGKLTIRTSGPGGTAAYRPEAVIGISPLRQYLIPFPGGRLQALDVAFDPAKQAWFNVYGSENRQPHEWGFWKNKGMNWNSQCAFCHMTGLEKGYDSKTDTYHTTWKAMGVSCSQCHEGLQAHLKEPNAKLPALKMSRERAIDNCAACHARREELTGKFSPGDSFYDHFRPILAESAGTYYPDGQVLNEDFEYGSFLMSRMSHKGVSCLDCHNPHTGKTVLPVENNALCLSCHGAPTRMNAIVIVPAAHTFHNAGTAGDRCVDCHMPVTNYMQRHPRRDHGFTIPDPLLTKENGTPNSCNRCHMEQTADWALDWTQKWYGDKMERRTRQRAQVVDRARKLDDSVVRELIVMAKTEEIAPWLSVLINLLSPWVAQPTVREVLAAALRDAHPLVRTAAVKSFGNAPEDAGLIKPLLDDPVRLVRLDATAVALQTFQPPASQYAEYRRYLEALRDQPVGAVREADLALHEGRLPDAERWAQRAAAWDPSAATQTMLGMVMHAEGKLPEAESAFRKAIECEPRNAELHYSLALFYGEQKRPLDALHSLQKTVELDPQFGRAWYNLGLAQAQLGQWGEAVSALRQAGFLMPQSAEPPYALATLQLRRNDLNAVRTSLLQALRTDPAFQPAKQLMGDLPPTN